MNEANDVLNSEPHTTLTTSKDVVKVVRKVYYAVANLVMVFMNVSLNHFLKCLVQNCCFIQNETPLCVVKKNSDLVLFGTIFVSETDNIFF